MASIGTTKASLAAFFLLFVFALSLPPKWATLHVSGLALVAAAGFARRVDWHTTAMRAFLLYTALWLIPVLLAAFLQHAQGIASAPEWLELLKLVLRMLGIGIGLIILIQRGWLTVRSAVVALLCALAIHAGAGLLQLLAEPGTSLAAWRQMRINGLVFNPNPFGMFMALTAVLSAGLLRGQLRSPMLWTLLITALLCVWASGSRGAALTTAVGLVFLFPPINRTRWLVYLGCGALMASVYLYVALHTPSLYSGSDTERMQAFAFSLEKIRLAPWTGWGLESYEYFPDRIGPNAPHNMWLDIAVSSGLVALAGALLSTALLAYRLVRCGHPAAQLALAVFAASVVAGSLEYSILISTHFRGVWVVVTALACITLSRCNADPRPTPASTKKHEPQ
jgi:O-antigen ligase